MSMVTKLLIGAGVGGALYAGYTYFKRLAKTSAEMESVATMMVHKLDLTGLTIRIDILLKNPTQTPLKMKFPFVKLVYKDAMIGSSQVLNKDISIPAFGQAKIDQVMVNIPIVGLFSIGAGLIASVKSKQAVKMLCKTITTIDLGFKQLPYEKSEELVLKS